MAGETHTCCGSARSEIACADPSVITSPRVREALLAIENAGALVNWSEWTAQEHDARVHVLRLYGKLGRAPTIRELSNRLSMDASEVSEVLAKLRARDAVVLDSASGEIVGAYPFTNAPTEHQLTLGAVQLRAMCAIDALGVGAMYDDDVEIRSHCRQCAAPIEIATTDRGRAIALCRPTSPVVWASARYERACAANSLCTEIAFFCNDAHLQQWRDARDVTRGFRLSLDEALEAGRAIFGRSLQFNS